MKTDSGYNVAESFHVDNGIQLIRVERDGFLHNHVTWLMNEQGNCSDGNYFETKEAAEKDFQNRKNSYKV